MAKLRSALGSVPWYKDGLRFECQPDCHECCLREGIVKLVPGRDGGPSESQIVANEMKMTLSDFVGRYVSCDRPNGPHIEDKKGCGCPLWKDGCSVYPARPSQCRTYPFWPELVKTEKRWLKEAAFCPGIGKGRRYSAQEIHEMIDEVKANNRHTKSLYG